MKRVTQRDGRIVVTEHASRAVDLRTLDSLSAGMGKEDLHEVHRAHLHKTDMADAHQTT